MNQQVQRMTLCLSVLLFYLQFSKVASNGMCLYASEKRVSVIKTLKTLIQSKIIYIQASWFDAQHQCQENGMCLAMVPNEIVLHQIQTMLGTEQKLDTYWIGLNSIRKSNFRYVHDDKPAPFVPVGSTLLYNDSCVYLAYHERSYRFDSYGCDFRMKFLCAHTPLCLGPNTKNGETCQISEEVRAIVAY